MRKGTLARCKKAIAYMIDYKVGIKKASENFNVSCGSIHTYIHQILKYEDDEQYHIVISDMKRRYKKGW